MRPDLLFARPGKSRGHGTRRLSLVFAVAVAALAFPVLGVASGASTPAPKACGTAGAVKCYGTAGFPVTNYVSYVGGTAGPAKSSLSPIDVGWVNQQGGTSDIGPEATIGAQVAIKYLNADAGGIGGHPVVMVPCYVPDTVSQAAQCGQSFADNKNVSAIAVGALAIGNQAMEAAIAPTKKVLVFLIALTNVDDLYKPGFALYGDSTHILAPYATFAKQYLHAKTVSVLYEQGPGAAIGPQIIVKALQYEGIKTHIVGFDPSQTDLTTPLTADDAQSANLIISTVGGTECANLYKATQELKLTAKVGVFGPCASSQVQTADGGSLPSGWYYASANSVYQDPADPDGPAFYKASNQFGQASYAADPWVTDGFGQILTIAKWENAVLKAGETITPANVAAVASKFSGPVPFGAQQLVCGKYSAAPAACNDKSTLYLDANGVWHAIARWVSSPPGFIPPAP